MTGESHLYQLMEQGGWVMWILLAFSVATVAVAIHKALVLSRAVTPLPPLLTAVRRALAGNGSRQRAIEACRERRGASASLLAGGLLRADADPDRLERVLENLALVEVRRLSRGLGLLAVTAMTAPLLGFLGTVTGMMASFKALVEFGMSNPSMVALGISEALTTTAAGLVVAVPAQLFHQALTSRLRSIEGDLESAANFLLDLAHEGRLGA